MAGAVQIHFWGVALRSQHPTVGQHASPMSLPASLSIAHFLFRRSGAPPQKSLRLDAPMVPRKFATNFLQRATHGLFGEVWAARRGDT